MIKFKTGKTKGYLILYAITVFAVIIFLGKAIETSEQDPTQSMKLFALSGIILQITGFVFFISPEIIKIKSKREANLKPEGILFVISGLVLQGIALYIV